MGTVTIKWKDHAEFLSRGIVDFFRQEYLMDTNVAFYGDSVKVHKLIMAVFVPALRQSLKAEESSSEDPNAGRDFCNAMQLVANTCTYLSLDYVANQMGDVQALVEFMYTGQVSVQEERVSHLKQLADNLNFQGLVKSIEDRNAVVVDMVPAETDESMGGIELINEAMPNVEFKRGLCNTELTKAGYATVGTQVDFEDISIVPEPFCSPQDKCDNTPKWKQSCRSRVTKVFVKRGNANRTVKGFRSKDSDAISPSKTKSSCCNEDRNFSSTPKTELLSGGMEWRSNGACRRSSRTKNPRCNLLSDKIKTRVRRVPVKPSAAVAAEDRSMSDDKEQEAVNQFCQQVLQTWEEVKAASKSRQLQAANAEMASETVSPLSELPACQKCQKKFLTKCSLYKHQLFCGEQRQYDCKMCDYHTTRRHALTQHRKDVHFNQSVESASDAFFKCPRCMFTCNTKRKLRDHIVRMHVAEKQYKCPECQYSAMYRGELERHIGRKHVAEKRFVCELCGGRYQTKASLNRHRRTVHEGVKDVQATCEYCGKNYHDKRSLRRHVQVKHTGDVELHVCDVCGNSYNRRHNLQYHMRHSHGTSLEPLCRGYGPRHSENKTSAVTEEVSSDRLLLSFQTIA